MKPAYNVNMLTNIVRLKNLLSCFFLITCKLLLEVTGHLISKPILTKFLRDTYTTSEIGISFQTIFMKFVKALINNK